jgi:uncharacterized protein (TIGR02284 family)
MDNQDVIATLNSLLEISRDGEQGFRTCAEGVQSPNLKVLLEAAARRCTEGAAELEAKVRSLGGEPAQGGVHKRLDASRVDQYKVHNHWNERIRGTRRVRAWRRCREGFV